MNQDEVFAKVKNIVVEQLGIEEDKITMDASFKDDLEADSLDLVELIMAFEEEFGGEFDILFTLNPYQIDAGFFYEC